MAKSNNAPRKSRTHFEQVPLEVVKKIAEQDVPTNGKKTGTARADGDPMSSKKRPTPVRAATFNP